MKKDDKKWRDYEEVSAYLLNHLSKELGLIKVEGKQKLVGSSGTEWEIDAKGICKDNEGIVIIECRRYTTSKQNQEKMAGFAWRIVDTGAKGGIIVSQLGLQRGAKLVAKAANITNVIIDGNSTPQNFAVEFLNKLFLGTTISAGQVKMNFDISLSKKCAICGETFLVKGSEAVCQKCSEKSKQALNP